jgi:hypothetical protein
MWADPASLATFRLEVGPDEPMDVVFWGKDEETAAARLGAPALDDGSGQRVFGWLDQTRSDAERHAAELTQLKESGLQFAADVRPHNDAWALLRQARASATGSGTVRTSGAAVCGFFTSWGDGAFPVYRDLDARGELVRVRVELGAPEIVE